MTVIGCPATSDGQELGLLVAVRPDAEVDVVGAQHDSGELRVGVGVLDGAPAADEHAGAARRGRQTRRRHREGLRPGRGPQLAVVVADQRSGDPVTAAWRR